MTLYRRISGAWQAIDTAYVKVAGVWKEAVVWRRVAGVWEQITALLGATLNNASYLASGTTVTTCSFRVDSDGSVYTNETGSFAVDYTWLTGGGVAADYDVRWTSTSGSLSTGSEATWESLAADRTYSVVDSVADLNSVTCTGTVEIRDADTLAVLATATVTIEADRA